MLKLLKKKLLTVLILLLSCSSVSRAELNIAAFETQLDYTIRSACHGFMVDAIPDFLSDARSLLNENTPFCQTVRTLGNNESAFELLKQQRPGIDYDQRAKTEIKITGGYNADLHRHSDCNDWMCQHVRDQAYDDGHPISLADYKKVEQHCGSSYGCIESWFKSWPRPLPAAKAASSGMSLDSLMNSDSTSPQPPNNTNASKGVGLSLDQMMGTSQPQTAPRPQTQQLATNTNSAKTGLSLDASLGTIPSKQPKSADISLDNIHSGREQLALEGSLKRIRAYHGRLQNRCQCSIKNSGCYKLPDQSLLKKANNQEQQRFQSCQQWQAEQDETPTTSKQAKQQLSQLANLEKRISSLDNGMENAIAKWEEQRRREIARQQREAQERADAAYLAGMASILLQAGAATNGSISAEQAAQNAVNTARSVERGESFGSALSRSITSAIPHYASTNSPASSVSSNNGQPSGSNQKAPQPPSYYVICKTETRGTALTAGCIGVSPNGDSTACSGPSCGSGLQDLCRKVGGRIGTPFAYYASGLGSFKSAGQCVSKCENDYGVANWGQYGRKCLGVVSN